jgi:hypothetical protein
MNEETLRMVQEIFPEKTVKMIVACKGTERTMGPPKQLHAREAPYRRAIIKTWGNSYTASFTLTIRFE